MIRYARVSILPLSGTPVGNDYGKNCQSAWRSNRGIIKIISNILKPKNIINSIIILAVFTLVFFANTNLVFSGPAPWGIAINADDKTCANYWAGDEFTQYSLPKSWESYYPEIAYSSIDTSLGSCKFNSFSDFYAREITDNWRSCFNSISCNYVDYDNFNKSFLDTLDKEFSCVKLSNNNFWGTSLAIDTNNKQCTLITCAQSISGALYKKYSSGLELYQRPQEYITFKTKAGSCVIKQNHSNDFSECCGQLGYTFVKDFDNFQKNANKTSYTKNVVLISLLILVLVISGLIIIKYKNRRR